MYVSQVRNKHENVMKRKIATHNAVFGLLVKTNSAEDWGSYRCNQTVIPSGSWEEQHTHYQIGSRLIPNLKLSTVCLRISLFDLSLIQSSHRMMPSETGTLQLAASVKDIGMGVGAFLSGIFFPLFFFFPSLCLFHFMIRVTCWHILLCPVASRDISGDMIIANGCRRD